MDAKEENNPEHTLKQGDNNQALQIENQIKNQEIIKEAAVQNHEDVHPHQTEQKLTFQEKNQQKVEVAHIENHDVHKEQAEKTSEAPQKIEIQKDQIKKEDVQIQNKNQEEIEHEEENKDQVADSQVKLKVEGQVPKQEQAAKQIEVQNKINQEKPQLLTQPKVNQHDQEFQDFQERAKIAAERSQQIQQVNHQNQNKEPQIKITVTYVPPKQEEQQEYANFIKDDDKKLQQEPPSKNQQEQQKQQSKAEEIKNQDQDLKKEEQVKNQESQQIKELVEQIKEEKNRAASEVKEDQKSEKQQQFSVKQNIQDPKQDQQPVQVENKQPQSEVGEENKQKQSSKQEQNKEQENQENQESEKETEKIEYNPNPIRMTQQNEQPYQETINPHQLNKSSKEQIVQFVQYTPPGKPSQIQKSQEKTKTDPYKDIQNQALLKRIQQLEATVQQLKHRKQANQSSANEEIQEKTATQTVEKHGHEKKKHKEQIIHDQSVHGLVSELAKTQSANGSSVKKPILQEKRYKRRKLDLSSLMDKNMIHASNIFNLTIGQILNPNAKHEEEKEVLKKQIRQLRQKVLKLQEDKRSISAHKPVTEARRQNASTGKKQLYGKLIKVSELKASRISGFDDNDSTFKANINQKIETRSQRESLNGGFGLKNKVSTNSATQRQERESQKEKDNQNNLSFRVRRPTAKSMAGNQLGQNSSMSIFASQDKIDTFPISMEDKKEKQESKILNKQWWEEPFIKVLQMPELPSPPTPFDSQQDLYTLGKLTFIAFGINLDTSKQMSVKKYKNCVYFNLGEKNNILWYFDGRFYIGEWQVHLTGEGEKSGQGFQYVPGKFIYQGEFKQGKRNNYGTIKILNKEKIVMYEGDWVDGNKCGQGKQIDEYGIKYWGEWKDNKREGFGKLKLEDGDYYEGNFQKGIKTGFGKEVFKNGDKYEGNYLANKFHGKGKYIWKNGSIYDGQFTHGIRSGQGKWRSSQTATEIDQYEGQYENDKKNGFGKYRWADGSEYEGFFKDDLKQGEGTIRYKNGKVAKLLWKNGQPIKKIFSDEQKNYRQNQKSRQKIENDSSNTKMSNRKQTINSSKKTME